MKLRRFGPIGTDISELVFGGGLLGGIPVSTESDVAEEEQRTGVVRLNRVYESGFGHGE